MADSHGMFYRRNSCGSRVRAIANEVHDQMLYSQEQLGKLALLRLQIEQVEQTAERMIDPSGGFDLHATDRFDLLSFSNFAAAAIGVPPASRPVFRQLLDLPGAASEVNVILDQMLTGKTNERWARARATEALAKIKAIGEACRRELDVLLGPLPPDRGTEE